MNQQAYQQPAQGRQQYDVVPAQEPQGCAAPVEKACVDPGDHPLEDDRPYARSEAVRAYVLARASGICEACGQPAPFKTAAGRLYLETHHIRRLSDGGPDDPRWVIALCPNCHRQAHYAKDKADFKERATEIVHKKELRLADH